MYKQKRKRKTKLRNSCVNEHPEEWFNSIGEYTYTITKPHYQDDEIRRLKIVKHLVSELKNILAFRLYTGRIRGSATRRIARVYKNVKYWLQEFNARVNGKCIHNRVVDINLASSTRENEAYPIVVYTIDFDGYTYRFPGEYGTSTLYGRVVVELFTKLTPRLVCSKFMRWMRLHFDWMFNPLNDKFETECITVARFWFTPFEFVDCEVYKFKVADNIIPGLSYVNKFESVRYFIEQLFKYKRTV